MRQITKESVKAFLNAKKFNKSNMSVEVLPNVTILKYQGNAIAYKYNDPKQTISITNCGWETNTTKERLNGILEYIGNSGIYQKNFIWYLNGEKWNGNRVDIKF